MELFPPAKGGWLAPHKAQQAAPQAPMLLANTAYCGVGTKDAHHTSITKGTTKNRQVHTTTAAGKSTIER